MSRPASGDGVLRVESLAVRLGANAVLRDVSLELRPGEVVGLLGRNGAGKTTLLRAISRNLEPQAGEVRLDGRPIASLTRRELARAIAVVPQESGVPFPFTAGELVLMGRAPHQSLLGLESSADLSLARAAMSRMDIAGLADRPVTELSGGERQLVIFARALAQDAAILLLDEPTAFLDLRHRIEVLRVVRELAGDGRAALVVSHDLGLAARACDRLVLLRDGAVSAAGPAVEVLTPERLDEAFGISAQVLVAPDGDPVVIPRLAGSRSSVC